MKNKTISTGNLIVGVLVFLATVIGFFFTSNKQNLKINGDNNEQSQDYYEDSIKNETNTTNRLNAGDITNSNVAVGGDVNIGEIQARLDDASKSKLIKLIDQHEITQISRLILNADTLITAQDIIDALYMYGVILPPKHDIVFDPPVDTIKFYPNGDGTHTLLLNVPGEGIEFSL
ncbi:MAG: hypothetical protein COT81_02565 [Candidatus Buchananbacteria bacterium CG10_big_fil_rev_8_21_14_0_10_42_9]|uniref:Uncharacterized protein n=1 Tax=Candidatus Buchananbacteria bacterium CG10_big_fil_rev_8_21_14_0_10_42_9 TaxID=1974526 RepID=A0A2H0W1H1_9BACT|nr:MAG: hypothetical protein COT81_02565 [Candidatus Buchananbacteria bacterium CG10_big_fil_rev_8_21_14_0_10_42_9]